MKLIEEFLQDDDQPKNAVAMTKSIIKMIKSNPKLEDDTVHRLAQDFGMDPEKFEELIYAIMHNVLKAGPGRHVDDPDDKYDAKQLAWGIKVEKEHTDCSIIAKEIAKDHLAELPDYYTRLAKMESEGGIVEHTNL